MTRVARETLLELISPGDPPVMGFSLVPMLTADPDKLVEQLEIVGTYAQKREAGLSAQEAAAEAGEEHKVADRTIFRHRKDLKRLGERLRGGDKPDKPR
jgi:hypothetical protein